MISEGGAPRLRPEMRDGMKIECGRAVVGNGWKAIYKLKIIDR